jgi:glycosyltransferase involved in cell wall biosynthesis
MIVCCHNSARRLPETLKHLAAQVVPPGLAWEVLVVDNASTDETRKAAESFAGQFAPGQLRVIDEPQPGLSSARLRGADAARYEFLCFVDDDNWVAADWVAIVFDFFSSSPKVGAAGGMGAPVFQGGAAPPWFDCFAQAYAAGPQYPAGGDITDQQTSLLWGAGLCVRRTIFQELARIGFEFMSPDRKGGNLSSGGDVELCLAIRALGWRLHYLPALRYQHFIPPERLEWSYLRRLFRGAGESAVYSRMLRAATDRGLSGWRLALERRWTFQALWHLRALLRTALRQPRGLLGRAEGCLERLQCDALFGSLSSLFRLRGEYHRIFDATRQRYLQSASLDKGPPPSDEH